MTLLPNCYARIWKGYRLNLAVICRVRAAVEGIVGLLNKELLAVT